MTSRVKELLGEALGLRADERADVAAELIASLDNIAPETDPDAIESAWAAEIERRARRVLAGESTGKSWEEVRRRFDDNPLG